MSRLYILLIVPFLIMSCEREKVTAPSNVTGDTLSRPKYMITRDSLDKLADEDVAVWLKKREKIDSLMRVLGKHEGYNEFKFGMSRAEFDVAVHIWKARPCHNLVVGDVCYENLDAKFYHGRLYELEFTSDSNPIYRYTDKAAIRSRDKSIDKKLDTMFPSRKHLAKKHYVSMSGSYVFTLRLYNPVITQLIIDADKLTSYNLPAQDKLLLNKIINYKRACVLYDEAKEEDIRSLNEEIQLVTKMPEIVATR